MLKMNPKGRGFKSPSSHLIIPDKTLKKTKRKFYDTRIIPTTLPKINQIQNIIQIRPKLQRIQEAEYSRDH
jgi:hypothetical protein